MPDNIHIYEVLDPAEAAEHQRLTTLIEKAEANEPLTVAEIAELSGCSEAAIYATQQNALAQIRNQFPELKLHLNH